MGLLGFMEGETLQPGVADLPEGDLTLIRDTLDKMLKGEFTRFRRLQRTDHRQSRQPGPCRWRESRANRPGWFFPVWQSLPDLYVLVEREHHRRAARTRIIELVQLGANTLMVFLAIFVCPTA